MGLFKDLATPQTSQGGVFAQISHGGVPLKAHSGPVDFAIGAAKGIGETIQSVGQQAANYLPAAVSPALSAFPKVQDTAVNLAKKVQGTVGLTDQNLASDNATQTAGIFTEHAAEALTGGGLIRGAAKAAKFSKGVIDAISPKITPKVAEAAFASGKAKVSGLLKKVTLDYSNDPHIQRVAKAIEDYVPTFDPTKPLAHNINETRTAVYRIADQLKQAVEATGQDVIYPFKQLASTLKGVERPTSLTRDLEPVYERVQAKLLEIVKQNGGKLSNLFDARKEFDQFVEKALPNLYDKEYTPMRIAVTDMRRAVNDFIAENLPKDIGFHDSLTTQSRLFDAIDTMAEKAAAGQAKEVGTNVITRGLNKFPKTKKAIKYGLTAVGGGVIANQLGD